MKLIEKEIATEITGSEDFVCVNDTENLYKHNDKMYKLTEEGDLYELEGVTMSSVENADNDTTETIQLISEEVQSELY